MQVAVVVAAGPLDKFGYQHNAVECVGSMGAFADRVYLVQSTRSMSGIKPLVNCGGHYKLIRRPETWFDLADGGEEWFDVWRVEHNKEIGLREAAVDGYDAAVVLDVNCYIPEPVHDRLWHACKAVVDAGVSWGWLYRANQVAGQMFHANKRLPRIINLGMLQDLRIRPDSLAVGDEELVSYEYGDYRAMDGQAVVDAELELTPEECAAKHDYMRCYSQVVTKRSPVFDWEWYWPYLVAKYRQKPVSDAAPDVVGFQIMAKSDTRFVATALLRRLGL